MAELLAGREPVVVHASAPLIESAGAEKGYRTGEMEYRALCGVDLVSGSCRGSSVRSEGSHQ